MWLLKLLRYVDPIIPAWTRKKLNREKKRVSHLKIYVFDLFLDIALIVITKL